MKEKYRIIVDVERMKHPFTGLYYYCKNLAVNLEKYHSDKFDFYFFTYPKVKFPSFLKKINRSQLDKFYLTKPKKYKIWHATWQDTKYVPKNNMKFVYTIHDLNFLYTDKSPSKKKKLLDAVQDKINRADAITVISNFVKDDIEKNLDLKGKKVDVIYNGVEVNEYPLFDKPKYKPKNKFLFSVGTVLYKKHFHVLTRLLQNNDYVLVIGGIHPEKSYINQIEDEAKSLGVFDRVKLIGSITDEEKYWYMNNCEAFLFPSISEGFGLPPIEAMRLGKPVFLSTFTSLPEVGGNKAYYFENFEPEHMQEVLKKGLDDYHKNNRKQEIIDWSLKFTWTQATKEYVAVYQRVLNIDIDTDIDNKKRKKVTAIIPTLNEEENIAEAISNVQWADEILVIDSFSTDKTVEIAEKYGAKVVKRKFDNYSNQKNFAIEQAENDWIFVLDADERISTDLQLEIENILNSNFEEKAFWVPRKNYFLGKKVRFSGWQHDKVIRLFNRQYATYDGKFVHEEIKTNNILGTFKSPLLHYTCNDFKKYKEKMSSYAQLKAEELYAKNKKSNLIIRFIKPLYRFVYHYIIQFGFLDGNTGYKIASINYFTMKKRYKILKELYRNNK